MSSQHELENASVYYYISLFAFPWCSILVSSLASHKEDTLLISSIFTAVNLSYRSFCQPWKLELLCVDIQSTDIPNSTYMQSTATIRFLPKSLESTVLQALPSSQMAKLPPAGCREYLCGEVLMHHELHSSQAPPPSALDYAGSQ